MFYSIRIKGIMWSIKALHTLAQTSFPAWFVLNCSTFLIDECNYLASLTIQACTAYVDMTNREGEKKKKQCTVTDCLFPGCCVSTLAVFFSAVNVGRRSNAACRTCLTSPLWPITAGE